MLEVTKSQYSRLEQIHKYTLYLWAFSIFFPLLNFTFYLFAGVSIFQIIKFKKWEEFKLTKEKLPYVFLLLFVFWNLATLIYTEDLYYGVKQVEKKIPLFIIGIIGLFTDKQTFDYKKLLTYYYYGVLSVIVISVTYSFYLFFTNYYLAVALVKGFSQINILNLFEHRLYIGISILMITPLMLDKIIEEKHTLTRILRLFILIILFYLVYSSGSRIMLISMMVILLLLTIKRIKPLISKKYFFSLLLVLTIGATTVIFFHPRTRLTLDLVKKNKPLSKLDNRFVTWKNALDIIYENPILGVGLGDAKNELLQSYYRNGNTFELRNRLNIHNQYLQITLESGLIGLFIFLTLVFYLFRVKNEKKEYLLMWMVVFGFSFVIESVLSRNIGVFPFAFWIFAFLSTETMFKEKRSENIMKIEKAGVNLGAIWSIALLILMFLYGEYKSFNNINPNTYMTSPFGYVKFNDLPNKEQLPIKTDACSFSNVENFTIYERGAFLAPEIFITNIDTDVKLNFGVWCYLSENSNLNEVYIYAWDRVNVSYSAKYNLNKKGTWQFLTLKEKLFCNSFSLGIRIDLLKEFSNIQGDVIFALPEYKIQNIDRK